MTSKPIALLLATVLFAATAYAGDKQHEKMEIKVISDDGDGETHLTLDSDDLDFDLKDMQVGENRSVVDKEGRTILINRKEDGYAFNVDGKTIDMPLIEGHGGHDKEVNVWVMKDGKSHGAHEMHEAHEMMMAGDGVMIMSGKEIDPATQEIIRNALTAAGHTSVHFGGGKKGGPHGVKVVKKVVKVEE